ncbi:hypothetical protein ACLB2K_032016 [Fragaria x ananassa]
MSFQVAIVTPNAKPEIVRRTANYHPNIWGDRFINCDSEDNITRALRQQQVEELKAVVKREVFKNQATDFSHQLKLIDATQCLGVAYHFEIEIEEALEHTHAKYHDYDGDLYNVSLGFPLLRQHGYNVSCDIFNKFKDANGSFNECLIDYVPGMLSLYEAAHLRVRGEEILDEAVVFTTTNLEKATTGVSYPLAAQVTQALYRPLRKDLERVCARSYMSIYQNEASHNEALLKLTKIDFNLVQSLHKEELSEITKYVNLWWKELDFARKLSFARDRMVELYFWIVEVYLEPNYSSARKILTKVIALVSVMDDIYDAFATFEELEIFTAAMEKLNLLQSEPP